MGRAYAGFLALLAFATVVVRTLASGGAPVGAVHATVAMLIFAGVGFIAGEIAQWTVAESVRQQVVAESQINSSSTTESTHEKGSPAAAPRAN